MIKNDDLKEKLNNLVDKTPDLDQAGKDEINKKINKLIKASENGKKPPFKNNQDKLDTLTSLIKEIACVDYTEAEVENFKTLFKESFKCPKELFVKTYQEKRLSVLCGRKTKIRQQETDEKIRKLSGRKTSLLEIHALLEDLTSASHDIIELVIAVAISLQISTKYGLALLWLILVGPPSSDKTASVSTVKDVPFVYHLDTLTENSFISGFVPEDDGLPTFDLLGELHQKCFIVKDYTTLFSLKPDIIKKILGDMCAIYDKIFAKYMGTRGRVQYESSFSHIGCITPVALATHQRYMNMIGQRFVFFRILALNESQLKNGYEIAWSGIDRESKIKELKEAVSAYVWQVHESIPDFKPETEEQIKIINGMAELLRCGRAVVRTERRTGTNKEGKPFTYYEVAEIQIEEPWRALQQIQVLTRSLAAVHKRNYITGHEIELVRRVVMSSMPVDRAEVLYLFQMEEVKNKGYGLTRKHCAQLIGKDYNQAVRILTELESIGLLEGSKNGDEWVYKPKLKFEGLVTMPMSSLDHIEDLANVTQNS